MVAGGASGGTCATKKGAPNLRGPFAMKKDAKAMHINSSGRYQ
jgi:hypothetical protein